MSSLLDSRVSYAGQDVPVRELGAGHLFDGDLDDVTEDHRYCHGEAVTVAVSGLGETRLLCAGHRSLYFPAGPEEKSVMTEESRTGPVELPSHASWTGVSSHAGADSATCLLCVQGIAYEAKLVEAGWVDQLPRSA